MRRIVLFIAAMLLILCKSITGYSQETTADIQGQVTDGKTGLAAATVVATHTPTGTVYTTTTRKDGRYNFANVRVGGPYTIKVTYAGFKEDLQNDVVLTLGAAYTADFVLKPKDLLNEVVITTTRASKLFNNAHTGSQEIISHDEILKLPTINRSIQDFTKLEPTANGSNFGGRSNQYNNITVDGANFNNGFGLSATLGGQVGAVSPSAGQPISLDAIDQIQVNVSPYDVKQGSFTGAGVNAVTKSGTNTFRGSVYTYLKGPGTQGYHVEDATVARSPFNYYTRGASLGGAFVQNKLFFFVAYEEVKQTAPAFTAVATGPGASGTISGVAASSLDSLTTFLKNGGFSGGTASVLGKYNPGPYQGYSLTTSGKKLNARIDWNINSKNTFTLKYNYFRSQTETVQSTSRAGTGFSSGPATFNYQYGLGFQSSDYFIHNNVDVIIAELSSRISNKISNKFQAGYTRERDPRAPGVPGSTLPMIDILNGTGNSFTGGQIAASLGYETYTYGNLINSDVYQLSDVVTAYKGSHEITLGTQDYYRKYSDAFAPSFAGSYQFPSFQAFYTAATGGPAVDKYFQEWSNIPGGPFPLYSAGSTEIGLFIQDKWRATRNLTITYGLRYDQTIYKQIYLDNPSFDSLTFKNGASYNIGKAPGNAVLISPRIGFNWDVMGDRSLQVRGGFGIFNGPPPFVWLANQPGNNGVLIASNNYTNVPLTTNAVANPPAGVVTTPPTKVQSATSYGAAVTAPGFKYPTVIKTSLAVDKKFEGNWVATIEAGYSKDVNAVYFSNVNLNETNEFQLGGADNRYRYQTIANSNKYYAGVGGATTKNPNISSAILLANSKKGYAYTVTGRIQKTIGAFFASVAYTYSQAKNVATGGSTASSLWSGRPVGNADPNADNLSYADYYQPHRVIAYASYRIDYAKHFATSIGAIYEAAPAGVGSYKYNGDLNGDLNTSNDLIYIPRNQSEINLVKVGSGGLGTNTSTDPRSTLQIWNQLNNFINQDHYLYNHRGQIAQANAVVFPWFKHLDLNITQDVYFATKSIKHTLRFTLDLINAGNFVNRNWGIVKQQSTSLPLTYEGLAADGKTPSFSMPFIDAANQIPLVNSYTNSTTIGSRWQMQFGIRYLFN